MDGHVRCKKKNSRIVALVPILVAAWRPRVHDGDALVISLEGRIGRAISAQVADKAVLALVELLSAAVDGHCLVTDGCLKGDNLGYVTAFLAQLVATS